MMTHSSDAPGSADEITAVAAAVVAVGTGAACVALGRAAAAGEADNLREVGRGRGHGRRRRCCSSRHNFLLEGPGAGRWW